MLLTSQVQSHVSRQRAAATSLRWSWLSFARIFSQLASSRYLESARLMFPSLVAKVIGTLYPTLWGPK